MVLLIGWLAACPSTVVAQALTFTDVSAQSGLWDVPTAWGVTAVDIDGDGDTDLLMANNGSENAVFLNEGGLRFRGRPLIGGPPPTEALVPADVDGDGRLDLLACAWGGPLALLKGTGGGRFVEATEGSGLVLLPEGLCGCAAFGDLDGDGDPDLHVPDFRQGDHLYRNEGGTFVDVTQGADLPRVTGGEGSLMADLDGDGRLDIYVFRNDRTSAPYLFGDNGVFQDLSAGTDVFQAPAQVGGCALDADGDGDLDLLLVRGRFADIASNTLLINSGAGEFTDRTPPEWVEVLRRNHTACTGDVDNDGDLDVFASSPEGCTLWLNDGKGEFAKALPDAPWNELHAGGSVLCDLDEDGDLDLLVRARPAVATDPTAEYLFRNDLHTANWLKVQPVSASGSRFCHGAQVRVYDAGFLGEAQHLLARRDITSGCGWGCYVPFYAHFGLDAAKTYDVEVRFPGGARSVLRGVPPGQAVEARAGQG